MKKLILGFLILANLFNVQAAQLKLRAHIPELNYYLVEGHGEDLKISYVTNSAKVSKARQPASVKIVMEDMAGKQSQHIFRPQAQASYPLPKQALHLQKMSIIQQ